MKVPKVNQSTGSIPKVLKPSSRSISKHSIQKNSLFKMVQGILKSISKHTELFIKQCLKIKANSKKFEWNCMKGSEGWVYSCCNRRQLLVHYQRRKLLGLLIITEKNGRFFGQRRQIFALRNQLCNLCKYLNLMINFWNHVKKFFNFLYTFLPYLYPISNHILTTFLTLFIQATF